MVLAAARTSRPGRPVDLAVTATLLSAAVGSRVELASVATGEPRVTDALRRAGARRGVESVRPGIR